MIIIKMKKIKIEIKKIQNKIEEIIDNINNNTKRNKME